MWCFRQFRPQFAGIRTRVIWVMTRCMRARILKALLSIYSEIHTELIIKNLLLWVFILVVWVIERENMFVPINHLSCCLNRLFLGVLNSIFNPLCTTDANERFLWYPTRANAKYFIVLGQYSSYAWERKTMRISREKHYSGNWSKRKPINGFTTYGYFWRWQITHTQHSFVNTWITHY